MIKEFKAKVSKYAKNRLHIEIPKCIREGFKSGDKVYITKKDNEDNPTS